MKLKQLVLATAFFIPLISTTFVNQKSANAATRIRFNRGSYCGSYSGNFMYGRQFALNLRDR